MKEKQYITRKEQAVLTKKKIFDKKFNYYIEGVFIFEKQKVMLICRYDKNLNIKVEEVSI